MNKLQHLFFLFLLTGTINHTSAQFVKDAKIVKPTVKHARAKIFNAMINQETDPQIIDIRTPREYQAGHLKNAILINFYDPNFAKNIEKAGLDKNRPVYIYCRSGNRTRNSVPIFQKLGFKHVVNLVYGINEWNHLQLPVEK
jgi:rhodanese-related sulfurtransferase